MLVEKYFNLLLKRLTLISFVTAVFFLIFAKGRADELKGYLYLYGEVGADYISDYEPIFPEKKGGDITFSLGRFDVLGRLNYGRVEGLFEILILPLNNLDVIEPLGWPAIWSIIWFERYYVGYNFHQLFSLKIGGTYGAMEFLSRTWHRAYYLMPTIRRPLVANGEDEGGIVPLYLTGLEVSGETQVGEFHPGYILQVANGNYHFGSNDLVDFDRQRSFFGKIYLKRYFEEIGISFGYDPFRIYPEEGGSIYVQNFIVGGNLAYIKQGDFIGIAEGFIISDLKSKKQGGGGFLILSYPIFEVNEIEFRPFLQLGFMDWQDGQPFFDQLSNVAPGTRKVYVNVGPGTVKHVEYSSGVRIGVSPNFAFKVGFNYYDIKNEKDLYYISIKAGFGVPVFER